MSALRASPAGASPLVAVLPIAAKPRPPIEGKKPIAVGTIEGKKAGKVRTLVFKRLKDSNAYEVTDSEDLKPGASKGAIAKAAKTLAVGGVIVGRVSAGSDLTLFVHGSDGRLVKQVQIAGGTPEKLALAVETQFDKAVGPALAQATGGRNLADIKPPAEVIEEEEEPEEVDTGEAGPKEEQPSEEEEADPTEGAGDDEKPSKDAEEDDEKPSKDAEEDQGKDEPSKAGRTPFEIIAGLRGTNRQLSYAGARQDPNLLPLLPYKLALGPSLLANARLYPAAFFGDGIASHIGIIAKVEIGIATTTEYVTQDESGNRNVRPLKTSAQEWAVGLGGRIPLDPVEIGLSVLFGEHTFILRGDEQSLPAGCGAPPLPACVIRPLVPDVKYRYVRLGLEPRARFSKLIIGAHIAPRFLLSVHNIDLQTDNPLSTWFPGATGSGLDFGVMGGWGFLPFLDVVVGVDFVRYGFDFNALPADSKKVATGASDQYISGWLGARIHLGRSNDSKQD